MLVPVSTVPGTIPAGTVPVRRPTRPADRPTGVAASAYRPASHARRPEPGSSRGFGRGELTNDPGREPPRDAGAVPGDRHPEQRGHHAVARPERGRVDREDPTAFVVRHSEPGPYAPLGRGLGELRRRPRGLLGCPGDLLPASPPPLRKYKGVQGGNDPVMSRCIMPPLIPP